MKLKPIWKQTQVALKNEPKILQNFNDDFDSQPWSDKSKARTILDKGLAEAASNPSKERILSYCRELWQLLPNPKGSSRDDILGN